MVHQVVHGQQEEEDVGGLERDQHTEQQTRVRTSAVKRSISFTSRRRPIPSPGSHLRHRPSLMTFASATQFHVYLQWGQCLFSIVS